MKWSSVFYPLLLLGLIHVTVVIAGFRNKETIVSSGNDETHQIKHQQSGRKAHRIATVQDHAGKSANTRESQDKNVKTETNGPGGTKPQSQTNITKENTGMAGQNGNNSHVSSNGPNNNGYGYGIPNMMDMKTVFVILLVVTFAIIGAFTFRIIRSRSRRKTKKYGVLATRGSEVELTPLEQEDDDEDMTVFDVNST